jgi:hypothetical protein
MKREDIIRMAQEAGFSNPELVNVFERFAALVASAERKDIIELASDLYYWDHSEELIKAIRARGQA